MSAQDISQKLPNKKIIVLGGGTNSYVTNHLAISAPAYGNTAKQIAEKFKQHPFNKMDVDLILTKMANPSDKDAPDTPEDIEIIVKQIIQDPSVRIVVFNVAMVDFKPSSLKYQTTDSDVGRRYTRDNTFGKYSKRLHKVEYAELALKPYDKIINLIRKERKDIFLVGFKTTCNDTKEDQYNKGLRLLKNSSANIVFVNDVSKERIEALNEAISVRKNAAKLRKLKPIVYCLPHFKTPEDFKKLERYRWEAASEQCEHNISKLQNNGLITPEESSYWYDTREQALDALVDMALKRSNLAFTRSTVIDAETVPWNSELISNTLRDVVNYCIASNAYKPEASTRKTVGHFAQKLDSTTFLTSIRKTDFNELSKIGLVKVVTDGSDHIYAYGAKPSVGGQTQRSIFDVHPNLDCILHFHCPLKKDSLNFISTKSQFEAECGSHNAIDPNISLSCAQNTIQGLREYSLENGQTVWAVHLDHHGPNIVFDKNIDSQYLIMFIAKHWDLSRKTSGLNLEDI